MAVVPVLVVAAVDMVAEAVHMAATVAVHTTLPATVPPFTTPLTSYHHHHIDGATICHSLANLF